MGETGSEVRRRYRFEHGGWSLETTGPPRFRIQTDPATKNYQTSNRFFAPITVSGRERLAPGVWTHLAGVFDGQKIHLFVNGKHTANQPVTEARASSDKAILIGAVPRRGFNMWNDAIPVSRWNGAIDEIRISRGARYTENLTPDKDPASDDAALLHLDCDQRRGRFLPLLNSVVTHAEITGTLQLETEQ